MKLNCNLLQVLFATLFTLLFVSCDNDKDEGMRSNGKGMGVVFDKLFSVEEINTGQASISASDWICRETYFWLGKDNDIKEYHWDSDKIDCLSSDYTVYHYYPFTSEGVNQALNDFMGVSDIEDLLSVNDRYEANLYFRLKFLLRNKEVIGNYQYIAISSIDLFFLFNKTSDKYY